MSERCAAKRRKLASRSGADGAASFCAASRRCALNAGCSRSIRSDSPSASTAMRSPVSGWSVIGSGVRRGSALNVWFCFTTRRSSVIELVAGCWPQRRPPRGDRHVTRNS
eukprot:6569240-Prymnesium_polylepis.1